MNVNNYKCYRYNEINIVVAATKKANVLSEAEQVSEQYDEAFKNLVSR
ncbi:hypothetical protein MHZ36_13950 [Staphylococcus sp. ACRSN]|nr:hypothetical protein [Staphylococcus sp. ACRSN]